MSVYIFLNSLQYIKGLTSVSSSDDDIRDVSIITSNTNWSTQSSQRITSAERETGVNTGHRRRKSIYPCNQTVIR